MIIDKEYPATHSMSTSWYLVDEDGNVGIMEYNDNGPVPLGIPDCCVEDLFFGTDKFNGKFIRFNLTDEQIMDLLIPLEDEAIWKYCDSELNGDRFLKIDLNKRERFLELCENPDIIKRHPFCVSEKSGLYYINVYKCVTFPQKKETKTRTKSASKNSQPIFLGSLKKMLDENLVTKIYKQQEYWDESKKYRSPYYLFMQPYSPPTPSPKISCPEFPVSISQVPEDFTKLMIRLPVRFKDIENLQITQYVPCYSREKTFDVDGCLYKESFLSEESIVYTLGELCCDFRSLSPSTYTNKPTILGVYDMSEENEDSYEWEDFPKVLLRQCLTARFHLVDSKSDRFSDDEKKNDFIELLKDIQPRIIVFSKVAYGAFSQILNFQNNRISVNGETFPICELSGVSVDEIRAYADQPYRGKEHPMLITKEQMDKLVKEGKAKRFYI